MHYLEFEKPIEQMEKKLSDLKELSLDDSVNITDEMRQLEEKNNALIKSIYKNLQPWQVSQIARHPDRPYPTDYFDRLFSSFEELHGDRAYADDKAIIGGLAWFEGRSVMVIGQQKGRDTRERQKRNFGMPRPEGYRKALRLMKTAERFNIPVLTFIDTPGAYPGIGAEERGQSEAIARNLFEMSHLQVPIICTVIGEGGSGGALAIGVGDRVYMLEHSTYSVISPEGCASILWKSADKAKDAAEAMGITAAKVKSLGLIDEIIPEPLGGAHRDYNAIAESLRLTLKSALNQLCDQSTETLLEERYKRLASFGFFEVAESES